MYQFTNIFSSKFLSILHTTADNLIVLKEDDSVALNGISDRFCALFSGGIDVPWYRGVVLGLFYSTVYPESIEGGGGG